MVEAESRGVDLTPEQNGGVVKTITKKGLGTLCPCNGDTVFVHYVGTLADTGEQFDSSRDRGEPFSFTLGRGQVIKAWDVGIASMHLGETAVLTCRADYAYGDNGSPPKIPPGATLNFDVELINWTGEDISPDRDGTITRSIQVEGEKYATPAECAPVTVHAIGSYHDRVFYDKDVQFVLGEGEECGLPDGVDRAIRRMTTGETAHIHLKGARHTYGSSPPGEFDLPDNAELDWIVTLKAHEKVKASWELTGEEKLVAAEEAKSRGTHFLNQGKFRLALAKYKRIEDLLEHEKTLDEGKTKQRQALLVAGYLNSALAHLKQAETVECIAMCGKALNVDANNVKALYRRAQALQQQNDHNEAIADYRRVLVLEPTNAAAQQQIALCTQKMTELRKIEKAKFAGMFDRANARSRKHEMEMSASERKKAFPDSQCGAEVEAGTV